MIDRRGSPGGEMDKWDIDMQVLSVPFHGALVQG